MSFVRKEWLSILYPPTGAGGQLSEVVLLGTHVGAICPPEPMNVKRRTTAAAKRAGHLSEQVSLLHQTRNAHI